MIKKSLIYIFLGLSCIQCAKKHEKPVKPEQKVNQQTPLQQVPAENPVVSTGDYYFEFDEVIHYTLTDISTIRDVMKKDLNHLSKEDEMIYECYSEDYPIDLKDPSFLSFFEKIGYTKSKVDPAKYKDLHEIFREKKHRSVTESLCIPEYNDILIFRNKNKLVGLAKICFGCMMHHILGTPKNTREFGQGGDYEKLKKLLHSTTIDY
jgi:hypothetical protein